MALKRIDANVFKPLLAAALNSDREDLIDDIVTQAQLYKASPYDMALRMEIKHWCDTNNLPHPNFPSDKSAFPPVHEVLSNAQFANFIASSKLFWHQHKGRDEYHVNCNCRLAAEPPTCPKMPLPTAVFTNMFRDTIKYRGQLFVYNPRIGRCLRSKIEELPCGKLRLVQEVWTNGYVFQDLA